MIENIFMLCVFIAGLSFIFAVLGSIGDYLDKRGW